MSGGAERLDLMSIVALGAAAAPATCVIAGCRSTALPAGAAAAPAPAESAAAVAAEAGTVALGWVPPQHDARSWPDHGLGTGVAGEGRLAWAGGEGWEAGEGGA